MSTSYAELIERLRSFPGCTAGCNTMTVCGCVAIEEAADALAALTRELEEAREWSRLRGEDLRLLGLAAGAAQAFVEKLALCQPEIDARFTMAYVRGDRYAGPNYADELTALKQRLHDVGLSRERLAGQVRDDVVDAERPAHSAPDASEEPT